MTPKRPPDATALVADIGGTNTRVALCRGADLLAGTIRRYRNRDHADLASVLELYLKEAGAPRCASACVAVAGPVREGRAWMTNLDWALDAATLKRATRAENVAILNDLQAQGHALGRGAPEGLRPILRPAAAAQNATRLVIGIGTGFNTAAVFETRHGRLVTPSETGHSTFPAVTAQDCALGAFVARRHGFAALDDVLSGRGLENIFAWHSAETKGKSEMSAAEIMQALTVGEPPAAREAVQYFVRLLGRVAGNLALIYLPFGGIFLAGGVARAVAPHLAEFGFADAFADKGRFADFMASFPVWVIEDDYAALIGCAAYLDTLTP